jgi:hypothetical protein
MPSPTFLQGSNQIFLLLLKTKKVRDHKDKSDA